MREDSSYEPRYKSDLCGLPVSELEFCFDEGSGCGVKNRERARNDVRICLRHDEMVCIEQLSDARERYVG